MVVLTDTSISPYPAVNTYNDQKAMSMGKKKKSMEESGLIEKPYHRVWCLSLHTGTSVWLAMVINCSTVMLSRQSNMALDA